jgi:hypothetical protein
MLKLSGVDAWGIHSTAAARGWTPKPRRDKRGSRGHDDRGTERLLDTVKRTGLKYMMAETATMSRGIVAASGQGGAFGTIFIPSPSTTT